MASHLNSSVRSGICLLAGIAFVWTAGCASDDSLEFPPGGLNELDGSLVFADEAPPPPREKAAVRKSRETESPQKKSETPKEADSSGAASVPAERVLQAGDEIDIQIYREPELSGTFKIGPTGDIRHSLAGPISLAGMTEEEAETAFTQRLAKDYLVNPRVIIKLLSTQSSQIVLMGEVKKPGVYPLPFGEPLTLLQAIAGAGGFTDLASPDRIRIVRRMPDGGQTTLKFSVSDLLGGKGEQQDVPLEPNDVVMVPEVRF